MNVDPSRELRERAGSGVRWMVFGRLGIQVISLGYAMALARLVTPAEFGVYGLAFVILHAILHVDGLRVEAALIQLKDADEATLSAAGLFSLVFGALASAALFVGGPLISGLFGVDGLGPVLRVMSAVFILRSLFLVNRALIRRRLLFRAQVIVDVVKILIGGGLAVFAAARGLGVWALVVYFLARNVLEGLGTMVAAPWRPVVRPSGDGLRRLIRFGLPSTGSLLLEYTQLNLTDLFVGKFYGVASLGFYQQSFNLMNKPIAYIDDVVNRLAFPLMARKYHLEEDLGTGYRRALSILSAAALPTVCTIVVLAPELIRVVYGLQWVAAIPLLQVIAPLGFLKVWQLLISAVFHASGRPSFELRINAATVLVLATLLWVTRPLGVAAAAAVTVCASLVYVTSGHLFIAWMPPKSRRVPVWRRLAGPAIASAALAGVGLAIGALMNGMADIVVLIVSLVVMVATYVVVLRRIDRRLFDDAVNWLVGRKVGG